MGIDAIALVRIRKWDPAPELHAIVLEDACLVPTAARFASEPDELGLALRMRLGPLIDAHDDTRGIFMISDIANPRATTYDGIVDEIGEAGVWAPILAASHIPQRLRAAP